MSHLGKFFAKFGIVTLGYDFRGHGKSEDIPGYIDNYQTLINDFIAFTKLIDEIYPKDIPRFTISQSLGGMVSFLVSIKLPDYFRGMIFLAPCLQMNEKLNFLLKIVKFFNYITPKVEFNCFARKNDSSKNPAVFESIFQDKGIYLGGIKPRAIASISYGTEEVRRNLNNFNTPYLMVVGELDTLVDMRTNIELSKHSKNKDNTVLWVDNCWHDIAHEEEIWNVLEVARKWIEERI